MKRNDCEAVLYLHRSFRPRRRTGRGFLTGTVFLDAALLIAAFVLATSPFVQKPGIMLDLPVAEQARGIRANDRVLSICNNGMYFFNDQPVDPDNLLSALSAAASFDAALILEADQALPQSTAMTIYDTAAKAGFRHVFIATRPE
jgi:biopolymer transport protein ExbD